jgi:hypothetical protein
MGDIDGNGVNDLIFYRTTQTGSIYNLSVGIIFGGADLPHRPTVADADLTVTFADGFTSQAIPQFTISALKFNDDKFSDLMIIPRTAITPVGESPQYGFVISGKDINAQTAGDKVLRLGTFGETSPLLILTRDEAVRADVQYQFFGPRAGGYAGSSAEDFSAVVAGDVNGDGLDDFVVADKGFAVDQQSAPPIGRAYVFFGVPRITELEFFAYRSLTSADRIYQDVFFGHNLAATGDINADGYADFAVGRSREGGSLAPSSMLFFYGSPLIAGPAIDAATPILPPASSSPARRAMRASGGSRRTSPAPYSSMARCGRRRATSTATASWTWRSASRRARSSTSRTRCSMRNSAGRRTSSSRSAIDPRASRWWTPTA